MTDRDTADGLPVTRSARRHRERLTGGTAAAIVEFMFGDLVENPHRVGGRLQREPAGLYSARRSASRVVDEIDEGDRAVVVLRIDHRSYLDRPPIDRHAGQPPPDVRVFLPRNDVIM